MEKWLTLHKIICYNYKKDSAYQDSFESIKHKKNIRCNFLETTMKKEGSEEKRL